MSSENSPKTSVDSMSSGSLDARETSCRSNRVIRLTRVGPTGERTWNVGKIVMTASTTPPDGPASEK
jgi:hypothetical protein